MNRNVILGFVGGLVFAASLVIGLIAADAATDQGGGEPQLPGALGEPIEIVGGTPISDPAAPAAFDQPIEPTQAAYLPVDSGSGGGGSPGGGGGPAGGESAADATTPGDTTGLTVAPLSPDPFAPVEAESRFGGFFSGDLFFEFLGFEPFRFLDLCADDGGLPGCPLGVGGTVLAPFGDGGLDSLGDFRLGSAIRSVFDVRANCDAFYPAEEGEHPLFVWASQPAVFEITYYWNGRPATTDGVTVSNADFDDPEFLRFTEDAVEGRLAGSAWPRECFLLTEIPVTLPSGDSTLRGPYTVEVNATSFTGETASKTYAFDTGIGVRPPTYFWDRGDNNLDVLVPVKRGIQGSGVTVVHESVATTCAEVEAGGFDLLEVLPAGESGTMFYGLNVPIEAGPGSPYDRSYTSRDVIHVTDLEEGTAYLVCVWWFESAERSFDSSVVVEREMKWITTPNRLTASVVANSLQNTTGLTWEANSYTVGLSCGSGLAPITIPPADMEPGAELAIPDRPIVCDYGGRQIRVPTTGFFRTPDGVRREFAIILDPGSSRGFQRIPVDLSTEEVSGPILILNATFTEGSDSGTDRWQFGEPLVFEPLPPEAEELPAEIRLDIFASGVDPDGRDGLRVTAQFDRPVRLSASLLGDPCLTGPEPSFTPIGLSPNYDFRLDGLCLRSRYSVVLEVEDAAGNTAAFADIAPGLPEYPGARYFGGTEWTNGYNVEYTVRATVAGGTRAQVGLYAVNINAIDFSGVDFDLRGPRRCSSENREPEGQVRRGTGEWGDNEITVTVSFRADQADGAVSPQCVPYSSLYGRDRWTASVTSTFSIEEFEAGDVTVRFPAELVGFDYRSLDLVVVISGEVTG